MKKALFIFFLIALLWELALKLLSHAGDPSPELRQEILKYFTESDIESGRAYSQAGFKAGLASFLLSNALLALLAFTPLSARLEAWTRGLAQSRIWAGNILYILFMLLGLSLLFLPFQYYFSFVLEHRFGFSNMTAFDWFVREAKMLSLGAAGAIITILPALWIIRKIKFYWIFIVPVAGTIFGLFMSLLYPALILPVFYNISRIEEGSLRKHIVELTGNANIPVEQIYKIEESQYSSHTNAFFVGFGQNKKIYLYDTLIEKNTEPEVLSILAHEIGHWQHNHQLKGIALGFLFSLLQFGLLYGCLKALKGQGLFQEFHSIGALPLFILIFSLAGIFITPLESYISRRHERQADYAALVLTGDPDAFISSEIKLARQNKSRLDGHFLPRAIYASHPPALERIGMAEVFKKSSKTTGP